MDVKISVMVGLIAGHNMCFAHFLLGSVKGCDFRFFSNPSYVSILISSHFLRASFHAGFLRLLSYA